MIIVNFVVAAEEGKVMSKFHFVEELAQCGSISKLLQNMSHVCSLLRYSTKDKLPKVRPTYINA
jgi:hypothetical protein